MLGLETLPLVVLSVHEEQKCIRKRGNWLSGEKWDRCPTGCLVWKRCHCLPCLFYEQNVFGKGEIGQDGEKWDKTWREVGRMSLSELAVKTAPV